MLSLVNTGSMLAVCDSFLDCVQVGHWLLISPFLAFSVLLALLFRFLLLRWMRTAILAGGIAVVRSGFCSVICFAKDGEWLLFWFYGDWTIRSNSAWSKKNQERIPRVPVVLTTQGKQQIGYDEGQIVMFQ